MKIIVDKHEYAMIIRNCEYSLDVDGCRKCIISGICDGTDSLENMVEVVSKEYTNNE